MAAATFQFMRDTTIAITWKVLVNAFNLLSQVLILSVLILAMLFVGFVVKRAGRQAGYLAGFRN